MPDPKCIEAAALKEAQARIAELEAEIKVVTDFCGERLGTDPSLRRPAGGLVMALVEYLETRRRNSHEN